MHPILNLASTTVTRIGVMTSEHIWRLYSREYQPHSDGRHTCSTCHSFMCVLEKEHIEKANSMPKRLYDPLHLRYSIVYHYGRSGFHGVATWHQSARGKGHTRKKKNKMDIPHTIHLPPGLPLPSNITSIRGWVCTCTLLNASPTGIFWLQWLPQCSPMTLLWLRRLPSIAKKPWWHDRKRREGYCCDQNARVLCIDLRSPGANDSKPILWTSKHRIKFLPWIQNKSSDRMCMQIND